MDPMQIQNQQPIWWTVPQQQIPVQQTPIQQIPQQPAPEVDSFFDKMLKGIVDFIAKLAAPTPSSNNGQATQNTAPAQQPQQVQNIPWAWFLWAIGNTLENIWEKAFDITKTGVSTVAQGAQNYVSEEKSEPLINNQQILTQNYQPNTQQQVVPPVQPQPVPPVVQPQPVSPAQPQPTPPVQQ